MGFRVFGTLSKGLQGFLALQGFVAGFRIRLELAGLSSPGVLLKRIVLFGPAVHNKDLNIWGWGVRIP